MGLDIPSVKGLKVRREIVERRYEPAIDLTRIARSTAPKFLLDPVEFFKRTHVTPTMKTLIIKTLMGLLGKTKLTLSGKEYRMYNKLLVLPSLFGGGKSHSLAVLYHLLNVIRNTDSPDKARAIISALDSEIARFVLKNWNILKNIGINIVIVDCSERDFAPVPEDKKYVKTLWGYIAHQLGRYHIIASYDRRGTAPPKDVLREIFDGSGAVILIDEIARYYSRTKELSRDIINTFLMNLSEALTTEEVTKCVVVITVPYDVERGIVEEAHVDVIKPEVIKKILDRVGSGNTIPVVTTVDLPSVLRKRIFEEEETVLEEYGKKLADAIYDNAVEVARHILNRRGGREKLKEELKRTYPFHPETIKVLRLLHMYLSKYIQATRNPIRLASEAILAIKRQLYDWLSYEQYLIMPFHIPIILEGVLSESFPLTFSEYRVFREILSKDIVHPVREAGEEIKLGDNIVENIPGELHVLSFMVTAYIWLRSLAGGGLLSRAEVYPTTDDVAFAIMDYETVKSSDWMDVSKILRSLHGKLTYLAMHGGKWLFRRIPDLWQLIERYARDVLPYQVYDELTKYFGAIRGRGGPTYKIKVLKNSQVIFIKYGEEAKLPDELNVNRPTIVIFTREADDEEIKKVLERNNIIVLRPDVSRKISREDLLAKPKFKQFKTYWDGLKDALKYLVACERITDEVLRKEYVEELEKSKELFAVLTAKKKQYENDFKDLVSFLIPRVYHRVFIRRAGKIIGLDGLTIRSDAPLEYCIEVVLESKGYLKESLKGNELEKLIQDYLKVNIREKEDGVAISDIWNFFLTNNTIENIPVIPYSALMNAVYELVRGLDYGVKIGNKIYWKKIYRSKQDASNIIALNGKDIGEDAVKELRRIMALLQRTGETARLIYWEHLVEPWLTSVKPEKGKRIAVLKTTREVIGIEELKSTYNWEETLRDSAVFLEELKVFIELRLPDVVRKGEEFKTTLKVTSEAYKGKVKVEVISPYVEVSEKEFEAEIPVKKELAIKVSEKIAETRLPITVVVWSEDGEELGRETYYLVLRIRKPPGPIIRKEWLKKRDALKLLEEGKLRAIYSVRSKELGDLAVLPQLITCPAGVNLTIKVGKVANVKEATVEFTVKNLPLDKTSLIHSTAVSISNLGEEKANLQIDFDEPLSVDEIEENIELNELPDDIELHVEYEV